MKKVKIKRVKKIKKVVTTKEKILAGLGAGASLVGMGAGGAAKGNDNSQKPFVRTETQNKDGSKTETSKAKGILKKVFGITAAKADWWGDETPDSGFFAGCGFSQGLNSGGAGGGSGYGLSSPFGSNPISYTTSTEMDRQNAALDQKINASHKLTKLSQSNIPSQLFSQGYEVAEVGDGTYSVSKDGVATVVTEGQLSTLAQGQTNLASIINAQDQNNQNFIAPPANQPSGVGSNNGNLGTAGLETEEVALDQPNTQGNNNYNTTVIGGADVYTGTGADSGINVNFETSGIGSQNTGSGGTYDPDFNVTGGQFGSYVEGAGQGNPLGAGSSGLAGAGLTFDDGDPNSLVVNSYNLPGAVVSNNNHNLPVYNEQYGTVTIPSTGEIFTVLGDPKAGVVQDEAGNIGHIGDNGFVVDDFNQYDAQGNLINNPNPNPPAPVAVEPSISITPESPSIPSNPEAPITPAPAVEPVQSPSEQFNFNDATIYEADSLGEPAVVAPKSFVPPSATTPDNNPSEGFTLDLVYSAPPQFDPNINQPQANFTLTGWAGAPADASAQNVITNNLTDTNPTPASDVTDSNTITQQHFDLISGIDQQESEGAKNFVPPDQTATSAQSQSGQFIITELPPDLPTFDNSPVATSNYPAAGTIVTGTQGMYGDNQVLVNDGKGGYNLVEARDTTIDPTLASNKPPEINVFSDQNKDVQEILASKSAQELGKLGLNVAGQGDGTTAILNEKGEFIAELDKNAQVLSVDKTGLKSVLITGALTAANPFFGAGKVVYSQYKASQVAGNLDYEKEVVMINSKTGYSVVIDSQNGEVNFIKKDGTSEWHTQGELADILNQKGDKAKELLGWLSTDDGSWKGKIQSWGSLLLNGKNPAPAVLNVWASDYEADADSSSTNLSAMDKAKQFGETTAEKATKGMDAAKGAATKGWGAIKGKVSRGNK